MIVNELFELVENNEIETLKQLLISSPHIKDIEDNEGSTLLSTAVHNNNLSAVKLLIDHKANLEKKYPIDNDTVLISAAYANYYEIAKVLIENGANVNSKNESGYDALYYASSRSYFKIQDLLLKYGAKKTHFIDTSLIYASTEGDLDKVEQLLCEKVDVNLRNYDGKSAFMLACVGEHFEIAKILIDHGADINLKDYDYDYPFPENGDCYEFFKTPLMYCAESNNIEGVLFLMGNDVDIDTQTYQGETALMFASEKGNDEIVKILLENDADINLRDLGREKINGYLLDGKKNALFYAITKGNVQTVELLIQKGSDKILIKKDEYSSRTQLMFACEYGNLEVVKYLLSLDISGAGLGNGTGEGDDKGKTALMHASLNGHSEVVELLIEDYKENIDAKDCEGKTALMHACHNHHFDTAKFLLSKGADKDIKDRHGYSVLDSKDGGIQYFFDHLKDHNPEQLVKILTNFRKEDPIKYTTHDWDDEKFKQNFKNEYGDFKGYLHEVKNQWNRIEEGLYNLSPMLHTKIYNFLINDKCDYESWCSRSSNGINIGWSSLNGLEQWVNDGNDPFDFETEVYKIDGKTVNSFGDIIRIFKREIQVRTGELKCIKEKNMLKDIFKSINKDPKEKFGFTLNFDDMTVNQFYTDIAVFKSVIKILFKQFSEESDYTNIKIESCEDCDDMYYVLKVIQVGSFGDKTAKKMLDMVEGGDFSKIKENLLNLCDWSVESSNGEKNYRINFLKSDDRDNIERDVSPIGYTHIFRFYK